MSADDQNKPSNAQSALLDYYDDVLGSISHDPLKERENAERDTEIKPARVETTKNAPQRSPKTLHVTKQAIPQKKVKSIKSSPAFYDEAYEQKPKADIVAPLIIPATFPKLPPQTTIEPAEIAETKASIKTNINALMPDQLEESQVPKPLTIEPMTDKKVSVVCQSSESQSEDLSMGKAEPPLIEDTTEIGPPVWAKERFECLLFTVAGLKLAVPLISLGAIYKIESHFTPLVGRASWFMGLYRHDGRNVRVVDTAQLVMPDRVRDATRENYRYIIRLGGNNWGVACDSVQESIQLQPEEVKWRTERSKRGWLSGTVIEHMCALIDVEALTDILKKEALIKHSAYKG